MTIRLLFLSVISALWLNGNNANAQVNTNQLAADFAQLDSILLKFNKSGQFRESGSQDVSRAVMDQYLALFAPDVYVWDNYNPRRDDDQFKRPSKPYNGAYKLVTTFLDDVYRFCPKGVKSSLTAVNADFSKITSGIALYVIERISNHEAYDGSRFKSVETFQLTLMKNASGRFKITEMKDLTHSIDCSNCDYDLVGPVHPSDDAKINAKAWATIEGGFGVGQFNVQDITLANLDASVYDQLSTGRSSLGANRESQVNSAFFGRVSAEVMFGYKNQIGVGLGLAFSGMNATATYDALELSFRDEDFNQTSYNRIVRLDEVEEEYAITSLSVPVMARYTRRLNDKFKIHLSAGPQLFLTASSKTTSAALADFEARYQYDAGQEAFIYTQNESSAALVMEWTEAATAAQFNDPDREWRRRAAQGYDVGINQAVQGETTQEFDMNLGFCAALAVSYRVNAGNELYFGLEAWQATLGRTAGSASFMNNSTDMLGSRLSAMDQISFLNYYAKIGFRTFIGGVKKKA
ncbi:MAG: outer membrane beta-barrel protein [Flavobacteriales bacterium]